MNDTAWVALIGIIPATLIAAATLWTSIRNGRKQDEQAVKIEEVKEHTNGTLSELTEQLKTANATIDRMHKTIEMIVPTKK